MRTMKSDRFRGWLVLALSCVAFPVAAAPQPLKPTGKVVASSDGLLHSAFALDESGTNLATVQFSPKGTVDLMVGPPGGKLRATDISSFSSTPEKILGLSGYWFVVSNEGRGRTGAIVDPGGHIRRTTQSFDDCELSLAPKAFVAISERKEPGGNSRFSIQAYKPDGGTLLLQDVVIDAGGTIAGSQGTTFLGFTNSHLAAMVERPGSYNRKTDVREPPEFALYDVKTAKVGSGRTPPKLENFLDYVRKRSEKADQTAVIVLAEGQTGGYELVGPGEQVRLIDLTVPPQDYDGTTLQQQQVGGRIVFSLVADLPDRNGDRREAGRYALDFFSLDPVSAKVTVLGEIGLPSSQPAPWSAGGSKIAVARKAADGNLEILIYSR
jgi:hypothetical protein